MSVLDPRAPLGARPTAFEFFQAVRLLHRFLPEREPVGDYGEPSDEAVRFHVPPSMVFPAAEIQALDAPPEGPLRMTVNFMGLTGPQGVLPHHYTQAVAERLRERDPSLRDFLDIFHHRVISLFYRSWEKFRFPVGYERDQRDPVTRHVGDLVGVPTQAAANAAAGGETLLHYAGLLVPQQRSALGLQQMLAGYFDVPVEIEQFVGGWYVPARDAQCRLSDEEESAGRLGFGALVGDAVWDRQAKVRIRLGPLTRARYDEFLPGGIAHEDLRTLTRFYGGEALEFEIQLVLARDEVPPCVLGDEGAALPLGWSTWVRTVPPARDADDTILTL
jgi:type VI secretion system protein ImpH